MEDIFQGLGIEISIQEKDDFLKIRETLTRMGVSSRKENKLFQSCHILHKRGRYSILHFKELFILDGLSSDISESDISRRNTIQIGKWEAEIILITFDMNHINNALGEKQINSIDGIIGADVLKKSKAVIDYESNKLYLKLRFN